jgi:beta-glucosidase
VDSSQRVPGGRSSRAWGGRSAVAVAAAAATLVTYSSVGGAGSAQAGSAVPTVTGDVRVDTLLTQMTLDEKLTLLQGEAEAASSSQQYQAGYLPGVPRLGIPSLKLTDGPPGVITRQDSTGMTATMGVAATFSQADAKANGVAIGRDARALGQDIVLEPFVNMDRDTSWGRGFNTFGEDPLLTGQTGAAEITGVQSQGVMAQVKHYIAYDGGNNVTVDSQTLHEIYLQPFADAIKAGVSSVMCSYNVVNGYQACGNATTLTQILRNELGFKGFVTSDWGANHGTTFLNAGLDMEMPGGGGPSGVGLPAYFSKTQLHQAIDSGSIQESRVTEAAGRILYEMDQFGLLTGGSKHTITPENTAADEATVLKTAQDAATLLKNDGNSLPLSATALSSLAVIGPGAGQAIATNSGGEAAGGLLSEQPSALSTLIADTAGTGAHLTYAVADDLTGVPIPAANFSNGGQPGLLRTDSHGATQVDPRVNFTAANHNAFKAGSTYTWTGDLNITTAGSYWLNIQALGATGALTVDGTKLTTVGGGFSAAPRYGVVHPTDGNAPTATTDGIANGRTLVPLTAGAHTISIVETPDVSGRPVQIRLAWVTPAQQQANHDAAVVAAAAAKTAVVFAWNTGSGDLSTPLPDGQDQLISDIAAVNPNTIVVLQSGQPIALPWLSQVKSVVEAWYGGDQAGVAQADVLLGKVNPAGRLPFTWPASLDQELAHQSAHPERASTGVDATGTVCPPGAGGPFASPACKTTYSEGVDIGYRFYDATNETPLYPFGYGLSYSSFGYGDLRISHASADGGLWVTFRVTNTGSVAGDEVPQVYLGAPNTAVTGVQFAPKALAGYDRVSLAAGQSKWVTIKVPLRQLQYWSDVSGWTTANGTRNVVVGGNEHDAALTGQVNIQ